MTQQQNWSRSFSLDNCTILHPETESQIVSIVQEASKKGQTVRPAGSLFSWRDAFSGTPGHESVVVHMDKYNKILGEEWLNAETRLVTVQAGVTAFKLLDTLKAHHLTIPTMGNLRGQTIAGYVATGSHGKSLHVGSISSIVKSLRLVCHNGTVLDIDMQKARDPTATKIVEPFGVSEYDLARAVGVSVGFLGVISTVTVETVPLYDLQATFKQMTVDEYCDQFVQLMEGADFMEAQYYCQGGDIVVTTYHRVPVTSTTPLLPSGKPVPHSPKLRTLGLVQMVTFYVATLSKVLLMVLPETAGRWFGTVTTKTLYPDHDVICAQMDALATNDGTPLHYESEINVPMSYVPTVLKAMDQHFKTSPALSVPFMPIDIRVVLPEPFLLSGSHNRLGCTFDFLWPRYGVFDDFTGVEAAQRVFFDAVRDAGKPVVPGLSEFEAKVFERAGVSVKDKSGFVGGVSHWGKVLGGQERDEEAWKTFEGIRKRMDPENMFLPRNVSQPVIFEV
ncbi:hypothetical protein HDU98_011058 [Podochytrium sp. JEL0797]|nr:hypothetical protein HDU98_011058 [Podochytrium sp. JEL0797]